MASTTRRRLVGWVESLCRLAALLFVDYEPDLMTQETSETIRTLLESVIERTDDEEVHYKIRTALQLLDVVRVRNEQVSETLSAVELDEDLENRLAELGYLE